MVLKMPKVIVGCLAAMLGIQFASASVKSPAPASKEKSSFTTVASGYRNNSSGALNNVGSNGNYWSSAPNSATNAYNLNFNSGNVNPLNNNNRANGFLVRPVRAFNWTEVFVSIMNSSLDRYMFGSAYYITRDELHALVVQAYLDARRNERNKISQLEFELNLEENLWLITDQLFRREYKLSPLICFMIDWPTRREVFAPAFRDRIVSHLLYNMISPLFERTFIFDTYSCRKGKGTDFGIERFQHFVRSCTDNYRLEGYVLQLDVSGFFMSINKGRLYEYICRKMEAYKGVYDWSRCKKWSEILDYQFTDYLVRLTLFRNPTENCRRIGGIERWDGFPESKSQFHSPLGTGLIIGDLDSQLEQNIYMTPFDQWMKRKKKARYYCRYVDDGRAISLDRSYLEDLIPEVNDFLWSELRLRLHPIKTKIVSTNHNLFWLGACCRPYRTYCTRTAIVSFHSMVNKLEQMFSDETPASLDLYYAGLSALNSYLGHFRHYDEWKMVNATLEGSVLNNVFAFEKGYRKAVFTESIHKMLKSQNYA